VQDSPDDASLRTDAIGQRGNATPDTAREVAPARLNDLAQVHAQRFAAELADRVLVLRSQRFDTASVTLEPRELGRIDIQVRLQADTTHVAFTTQHAAVRDALEAQLPRLRALLEDAGLSLGGVDVSQSGGRDGADSGTRRAHEPQRTASVAVSEGLDVGSPRQRRVANALIDLHA
jgi:flagellar hook-length control protein FliK